MDFNDHSISWMIGGGLRADPAELRNQAHLRALRVSAATPSWTERIRAFVAGSRPVADSPIDQVCCPV